jgi:hypothetical protein
MRTMKMMFLGAAVALSMGAAQADVVSDRATALLIWPDIKYAPEMGDDSVDTVIQISNTSAEPILAHCFYENANSHCTNNGQVCEGPTDCCNSSTGCGICLPGWLETDFRVRLTPRQPLGWTASQGLTQFPLPGGPGRTGPDGSSNAGSRIPPVAEVPYTGALKCIAINDDGTPSDRNVLKGESTHVYANGDAAKHNAIGIEAIEGAVNDDNELILGGGEAEYNGCSNILIVNHMFDLGIHPAIDDIDAESLTNIVLVPCTQDLLRQIPGRAVVQFLVYNEFEQRFSTSRTADCKADWRLSEIDTTDPQRSIFSAGVAGTLVGQSRLNPIGSGFVGIANELVDGEVYYSRSSFNINLQGDRAEADVITLP